MITDFKLFEQLGGFNLGDTVLIMYKVPKTDKREIVPVKIVTQDGIHYQFSFQNSERPDIKPISFDEKMIKGKTLQTKSPTPPDYRGDQPVQTDYSPASRGRSGGQSNDFVLPNS